MSAEPPAKGSHRVRIGKYEILAHIATGGMGAVYKALDTDLGREVALKVLPLEMAARPGTLERFKREARSAAKLRHENIVAIYECAESNGTHYLALELVEGVDLHDFISRRGKLDPELARQILIQAARALAHAHDQGIVHRDIKPSNFLVSDKDGRVRVKLTDLGLARETRDDEFRLTRDGSTVGTVDYMAPEQARDSSAADIRSDIYSLGCTFYHMLAGNCPFPEGSLVERVYKHVEAAPPDIRKLNPTVPDGLVGILSRMLEKRPEDRYQTPHELLRDLEEPDLAVRLAPLEAPAPPQAPAAPPRPSSSVARARRPAEPEAEAPRPAKPPTQTVGKPPRKKRSSSEERRVKKAGRKSAARGALPSWWPWAAGAGGVLLVAVVVLVVLATSGEPADEPGAAPKNQAKGPEVKIPVKPKPDRDGKGEPVVKGPEKKQPSPAELARLRAELMGPHAQFPTPPPDAAVLRVSRAAPPGGKSFRSLAEACAAAPAGRHTVIEIHDNGPLFEPAVPPLAGRSLTLRAGAGYRPLLVWEGAGPAADRFLSVEKGSLALEGLDVVLHWPEGPAERPAAVCAVAGGDLAARDCTFSVAGRHPRGVEVVRLERQAEPVKARLSRCFLRGHGLTAAAVRDAGADVLLDGCLAVSAGEGPLLDVGANEDGRSTLRVLDSTLVAGKTLLRVASPAGKDGRPAVRWLCLDAVLAHAGAEAEGDVVRVEGGASTGRLEWKASGSVCAGWERLLASAGAGVSAGDPKARRALWDEAAGNRVVPRPWPEALPSALEEVGPGSFDAKPLSAAGCPLAGLPAGRAGWPGLTFDRFGVSSLSSLPDDLEPPILKPNDNCFHGEAVTLDEKTDLGHWLRLKLQERPPGKRVVLHLSGSGEQLTSPIQLRGADLVLYVKPPQGKAKPLTLVPRHTTTGGSPALIEVENGSLELTGVRIRFENSALKPMPRRAVQVRGGKLRLFGCHFQGPLTLVPLEYQGLIGFQGSGKDSPDDAHECALNNCVLVSAKAALTVRGPGARLWLQQCAVLSLDDGLVLEPGPGRARLNLQCTLMRNTFAARGGAIAVKDSPGLPAGAEPVVVQADDNLFLAPFAGEPRRSAVLVHQGDALARGVLLWQGKGNGYDANRLRAYAAAEGEAPPERQQHAVWARLWGKAGEQQPQRFAWPAADAWLVSPERPQLDRLRLPPGADASVGADLVRLGVAKKS
jgi:eukaryotic-like serine/threonine-protein kinase